MHCPENVDGKVYVELVAAVSIFLSEQLNAIDIFTLSEFMQSVSYQMLVIATFKEAQERAAKDRAIKEKREKEEREAKEEVFREKNSGKITAIKEEKT